MSPPEKKARPPAPLTTMTRIASSRSKLSMICVTASHISSETALCRAGLLKIRRPMPPSFSAIILLVMGWSSMGLTSSIYTFAVIASVAKQSRAVEIAASPSAPRNDALGLHGFAGAQLGDGRVVIAEPAQYLLGMLTEVRGRAQFCGLRRASHVDRLADHFDRPEFRMIDRTGHFEVLDLRVGKGLVDRIDRPARDADLVHQFDQIGGRAPFGNFADPLVERLAVLRALRPGCVIGVV